MSIQLKIDKIFKRDDKLFYLTDCGHEALVSPKVEVKNFYDEVLCSKCYNDRVFLLEDFLGRNPIGAPLDLTHPYKR